MNKPIYRHLAEKKWREFKRKVLEQRVTQLSIVPDLLGSLDLVADIDLSFGRKTVTPGDFVESYISEKLPTLHVQTFTPGEKLVTVAVVDADVPALDADSFTTRCHFIASNIVPHSSEPSAAVGVRGTHEAGPPPGCAGARVALVDPAGNGGRPFSTRVRLISGTASASRPRIISPSARSMSFSVCDIQTHSPMLLPAR